MTTGRPRRGALALLAWSALACANGAPDDAPASAERAGGEAVTIWTDRTELFFEHPPLIAGAAGEAWAVHLTELSGFRAVSEGRLTLRFEGPNGDVHQTIVDEPARPGVYAPAPSLPAAGMYDLVVTIEGAQLDDEIFVGPIQVFASEADLPVLPEVQAVGISFLKEQQWPIDFATAVAERRAVASGVEVVGTVEAAPGLRAEITAPVDGIVRWDLNRAGPADGAAVRRGEPILHLSPVGGDDAFAGLRAEAARLEREVERAQRLVTAEAAPARRLEEARHDLEVVRSQLEALDAPAGEGYVLPLLVPIDGRISARGFVPGQRVDAGAHLLTVLDTRRVHVVFHTPASYAGAVGRVRTATFTPEGGGDVRRAEELVGIGAALDAARRTVPVTFAVDNPGGALRPGMLVTGRLLEAPQEPQLAVPAAAVVDEDGLLVAYVQIAGESFERRAVTVGVTDGAWTTVLSGVRRGERVVVRGQYQIRLGSLNTSEISDHGHPH